ncbi:prepilin peptidase [Lacisediminimonas sp.]|uniref:A24 family peptidase n=1 Tax=Lacisediminimonas sp. TaxID=3060582 RepID=UPI002719204D|nr:A24 family peptidase [Lacisediminimonas sp.]MDO8300221.1 A24 family peptidase [Lacisediminimonas sp.]
MTGPSTLDPSVLALGLLAILLVLAAQSDARSHRIPNRLVAVGLVAGLALNALLPTGTGFTGALPGAAGLLNAMAAATLGLVALIPLYWLRAMGAGDVKLMAMVGAFLGMNGVMGAMIISFIAAGLMTVYFLWRAQSFRRLGANLHELLMARLFRVIVRDLPPPADAVRSVGRIPFGVAIAGGTIAYCMLARAGHLLYLSIFPISIYP